MSIGGADETTRIADSEGGAKGKVQAVKPPNSTHPPTKILMRIFIPVVWHNEINPSTILRIMFCTIGRSIVCMIAWLDFIIVSAFLYILSFMPHRWTESWYSPFFRYWCWVFIRALGVQLKIHQHYQHTLPPQWIVIANHPSAFEDLGMPALFKARFLAKQELRDWWILGRISFFARTLYVQRESRLSRKTASETIIRALRRGNNIGLYPEGGCKGRRISLPFQYGIFEAALQTGTPIIPVFIHYETQSDFEWDQHESLIQALLKIIRSKNKTANYHVFDPIDPKIFKTKEALCTYTQDLYLQWQSQYLV